MNDLISRQAAIATAISGRVRTLPTTEDGENWIRVNEVRDSLLSLPTAQPKHGKWIKIHPQGIYECSECHQNVMTSDIDCYKFCHQCGSRMDEG